MIRERFRDIDIVLGAGDLPLEYYGFIASMLNKPIFFVFGNHYLSNRESFRNNDFSFDSHSHGATYAEDRVCRSRGILIAGLGGTRNYNRGPHQYSELAMWFRAVRLVPRLLWNKIFYGRYLDILLSHVPPLGYNDDLDRCHQGFKTFLWILKRFKPRYHVHGHIHLYDINAPRQTTFQDTVIINAYNHVIIEIEE
jgi:Icc-related predicted phosphoesterase